MSTLDTAALWSATTLAFDEKKLGSAGLSIRQRKLLALLSTPASVAQLAPSIAMPEIDVQAALERFAKLGLAQSDAAAPFNPMLARSQVMASSATAGVESSSRTPVMIGVAVAVLALMAASAWLLRGPPPAASTSVPNTKNGTPTASAPAAATPSESADTAAPSAVSTTTVAAELPARTPTATGAPVSATATPTAATSPRATKDAPTVAPILVPGKPIELAAPAVITTTPSAPSVAAPAASTAPTPAQAAAGAAPAPAPIAIAAVAPTAPPPATVATAPPVATPTPVAAASRPAPAREIKLVNRIEPTFPRGVDAERGSVRARLQVDAKGVVTNVEIVESVPPRVFDRTVRNALQQWRYEPTGEAFSTAAEISFAR